MQPAQEASAPLDDELLFCEDCRLYFHESCPRHGNPTFVSDPLVPECLPSRALLTLPEGLIIKERPEGGLGVWCTHPSIPRGFIFGPYEGEIVTERSDCTVYSWAIRENGSYFYVDASDETKANWMRYVMCASSEDEHNITVFQYRSKIYYRASQPVPSGTQLLVWIGEEYARTLGLKLGEHFKYEFGEKELLMKLFQDLQKKMADPPAATGGRAGGRGDQYICSELVASIIHAHKAALQGGSTLASARSLEGTNPGGREGTPNLVGLGRAQSRYWTFFGFHGDSLGRILDKSKIICKLCGVRLSYSGNTTNLRQHLIYKHKAEYNQLMGIDGGSSGPTSQKVGERYPTASANTRAPALAPAPAPGQPVGRTTKAIAQFLVRDLLPLSTVEGEGFVEMLSVLEPTYKVPSMTSLAAGVLTDMHTRAKLKVTESLRGLPHCALSVDLWRHDSGGSYVTLAAHHVTQNFDYRNQVLASRPAGEGPTAETVRTTLLAVAEEWGVRDRASHAVVVGAADAELAAAQAGWRTLPCIGNVLQSCVDSALQQPSILKVLGRCKRLVDLSFSSSSSSLSSSSSSSSSSLTSEEPTSSETLLRIHSKMSLGSGRVKWTCVYSALQILLENRHLLEGLGGQADSPALVSEDWGVIEQVEELLKPLAIATSTFTREPFSSLSLVKPVITSLVYKHLAPNGKDSELAREVKRAICTDLKLCYSSKEVNQTLNLACALDPRFRGLDFLSQAERVETLHLLKKEAAELAKLRPPSAEPEVPGSARPSPAKKPKRDSAIEYLLGDLCNVRGFSAHSVSQQAEQEISNFQTSEASSLGQDPLMWWKTHHTQYPLLAQAARKLLAVPATAVPASWVLTDAGDKVYAKRSALDPEDVDTLVFLHGNGEST